MSLKSLLPQPKNTIPKKSVLDTYKDTEDDMAPTPSTRTIPQYPHRKNFIPKDDADFSDGGAYPEVHLLQFPCGMGRKDDKTEQHLSLQVDKNGNINYDEIIKQGAPNKKIFTKFTDIIESSDTDPLQIDQEEVEKTTLKTKQALDNLMNNKLTKTTPGHVKEDSYMKFTSGNETKIVKIVEMPQDPLAPSKFRNQKAPPRPPSPPAPILHSPPKKLTKENFSDWKIPPCVSNWVNPRGFTIPLDKRLAADGRGLQEVQVSNSFAKFRESLHVAEVVAREDLEKRKQLNKLIEIKEKEDREEKLKNIASMIRKQKEEEDQDEDVLEREEILENRRREITKEKKKSKYVRDNDRDISERIALGQPSKVQGDQIDSRLYNYDSGLTSGGYKTYDKPLFTGNSSNIYKPKSSEKTYDVDKIMNSDKFTKPTREFTGAMGEQGSVTRDGPVQFEREDDPFGMNAFLNEAKEGKKRTLDHIGKSGHMGVAGGSTDYDSLKSSKKTKIQFQEESGE